MTILSLISYLVTLTGQVSIPLTQASGDEAEPPPTPALRRTRWPATPPARGGFEEQMPRCPGELPVLS